MIEKNKFTAQIWRKNRNAIAKIPHKKNMWDAMKDQLIDAAAKISYHYQSEPTKKEILEYRIYWELISLCSRNKKGG